MDTIWKVHAPTAPCYAGFFRRLVAFLIDIFSLSTFLAVVLAASLRAGEVGLGSTGVPAAFQFLFFLFSNLSAFVYFTFFHANGGQTPGKMILGIAVVEQRGGDVTMARSVFRTVGYFFSALPLFAGFFWTLLDSHRQTWHDKLAGTVVVEI